ncbi:hypothetical protein PG987_002553 [Apiospora arundinis]
MLTECRIPTSSKLFGVFGRVPKRLEESYWGLLHFRTAEEEQRSRFLKQEEEAIPDTPFAKDVHWYLSACLGSCSPTESARFICVEGAGLDPTTMWEKLGLSTDTDPRILVSNTVKKLFRSLTLQIEEEKFGPSSASVESRSCPSHDPSLLVTWGSDAAWKLDKDFIRVEWSYNELLLGLRLAFRRCPRLCFGLRPRLLLRLCFYLRLQQYPSPSPSLLLPPPAAVPVVDNKRTYTLGEELDNINIVTPRKWFEATNAEGQEAVVGIPPQNAPKFTQKKTAVKRSASQSGTAKRPRHS